MRNEIAHELGFANYQDMSLKLSDQDPDKIEKLFDELDSLTRDAFTALKAKWMLFWRKNTRSSRSIDALALSEPFLSRKLLPYIMSISTAIMPIRMWFNWQRIIMPGSDSMYTESLPKAICMKKKASTSMPSAHILTVQVMYGWFAI